MTPPLAAPEQPRLIVAVGPSLAAFKAEIQFALGDRCRVVELLADVGGTEDISILGTGELPAGETQLLQPRGRHGVLLVGLAGATRAAAIELAVDKIVDALSILPIGGWAA